MIPVDIRNEIHILSKGLVNVAYLKGEGVKIS